MKKLLAALLIGIIAISLTACGSQYTINDYVGVWTGSSEQKYGYGDDAVMATSTITLTLYDDGTFREELIHEIEGYAVFTGTWRCEDTELHITRTHLIEGNPKIGWYEFDENGYKGSGNPREDTFSRSSDKEDQIDFFAYNTLFGGPIKLTRVR